MKVNSLPLLGCLVLVTIFCIAGCAKPRTMEEIDAERRDLPALYLTEKSLKHVEAASSAGLFVDEATGEICYPAYECANPDCPGLSADGKRHLFIHRDVLVSVGAGGEFKWEPIPAGQDPLEYIRSKGGHKSPTCDKCLENRNLESESDEEEQQYGQWAQPYELPETAKRREELDAEHQEAYEAREALRQGEG